MKKNGFIFYCLLTCVNGLTAQSITPYQVTTLPGVMDETSGIEKTGPNTFWSHNDSGGQPELYRFDSSGTLQQTIDVTNAVNIDWEELAQGQNGEIYIGDFGNNNNNRSQSGGNPLTIYIVADPDLVVGNNTTAGVLVFEYEDRDFNAPSSNHNFDMEAFFWFDDSLHLFTKNRTSPTNGWIKHYVLPAQPGTYQAMLVDSFNNAGRRITAADISPDYRTVALLAQDRIYLFSCFEGSRFLSSANVTAITIPNTQKEAIVFSDNHRVYITDEYTSSSVGQRLYRADLNTYIADPLTATVSSDTACFNEPDGSLLVIPAGGSLPYNFAWSNGATTALNDSLAGGNYQLLLTDNHGCSLDTQLTVFAYDAITWTGVTDTTCPAVANGSATVFPAGGEAPFSLLWSNGDTVPLMDSVFAGAYQVLITDNNMCAVTASFVVDSFSVYYQPSLVQSGIYLLTDYATGNTWYLNGTPLPNVSGDSLLITQNGFYQVMYSSPQGCHYYTDSLFVNTTETTVAKSTTDIPVVYRMRDSYRLINATREPMLVCIYTTNGQCTMVLTLAPETEQEYVPEVQTVFLFTWKGLESGKQYTAVK